jgi:hypothetical protein
MSIHFYVCFVDLILLNLRYDRGDKMYAKLFWYATYAGTVVKNDHGYVQFVVITIRVFFTHS